MRGNGTGITSKTSENELGNEQSIRDKTRLSMRKKHQAAPAPRRGHSPQKLVANVTRAADADRRIGRENQTQTEQTKADDANARNDAEGLVGCGQGLGSSLLSCLWVAGEATALQWRRACSSSGGQPTGPPPPHQAT